MSIYWLFLYVPWIFLMGLRIFKLLKKNAGLTDSNHKLLMENIQLRNYIHAIQNTMLGKPTPTTSSPKSKGRIIDDTTAKLIRLAIGNTSSNEASNAAIQVCNRLSKKLK
jgi:hypothetical protein